MTILYVYIYLEEGPVPAGLLEMVGEGHDITARFRYGRRYLQRKDRLAIDPVQLPLHEPEIDREYMVPEGFVLFNGIRDAAPDSWGRYLMDRAAGSRILTEYDYLIATGEDRVGALAFGPDLSGPKRLTPWGEDTRTPKQVDLAELLMAVQELDTSNDILSNHYRFLLSSSSLGGARPKATLTFDGKLWIAKFSRPSDLYPICRIEYAAMRLAKKVGISVPPIHLEKVLGQDVYLIERFDRIPSASGYQRIPFISGLTITGAHEEESSQQSYLSLAEQLRLYGSQLNKDMRQLWQRMVFNILCNNTDDHLRNHGFLWDDKGWQLSPAYDIVPLPQIGTDRYLAIGVGKDGRHATLSNALSQVSSFGLTRPEAIQIVTTMQKNVKENWERIFKDSGFNTIEIERLRSCFIASETPIDIDEH